MHVHPCQSGKYQVTPSWEKGQLSGSPTGVGTNICIGAADFRGKNRNHSAKWGQKVLSDLVKLKTLHSISETDALGSCLNVLICSICSSKNCGSYAWLLFLKHLLKFLALNWSFINIWSKQEDASGLRYTGCKLAVSRLQCQGTHLIWFFLYFPVAVDVV